MCNGQSFDNVKISGGSKLPPTNDDGGLLALEMQLDDPVSELLAARKASAEPIMSSDQQSLVSDRSQASAQSMSDHEARTKQAEAILARLYPIEQAIMATPAHTITGLGVKARHAAYVMSQYWEEPIDRIDWEARAVNVVDLMDALRKSIGVAEPARETKPVRKPRKVASGQKEMLMPIAGKKPAKETAVKKSAAKPQRKSA
jgi:hypothetical protein